MRAICERNFWKSRPFRIKLREPKAIIREPKASKILKKMIPSGQIFDFFIANFRNFFSENPIHTGLFSVRNCKKNRNSKFRCQKWPKFENRNSKIENQTHPCFVLSVTIHYTIYVQYTSTIILNICSNKIM